MSISGSVFRIAIDIPGVLRASSMPHLHSRNRLTAALSSMKPSKVSAPIASLPRLM